jgi:hypothetical protein
MASAAIREELADYDAFADGQETAERGLLLGSARTSGGRDVPIRLPWGREHPHWLVQGAPGTGKTTWIASLFRQELAAGRSVGVVDCKGDLFEAAVQWTADVAEEMPPDQRERLRQRLVVVNPFAETLVPFNVCRLVPGTSSEVQAFELALALSRLFESSMGLHMENILRHLLILLIESGLSLVEAPLLLQDDVLRGLLATKSTHPAVKEFFLGAYGAVPQVSKDALLSRLQGFLLPEGLRLMLGAESLVDLRGILERGDPLLVFLGKGPGVPEEQVEVMGSLFLQLLLQAVYARGTGAKTSYLLAVDEFFHLLEAPGLTRRFETALTTTRTYGLALMLIHHNFAQLPPGLREIILGNCDLVALFRTSVRNAEHFGDFLPTVDPELVMKTRPDAKRLSRDQVRRHQLEALQRLPDRTCFWYDRRRHHRAIRMRIPDVLQPRGVVRPDREAWRAGAVAVSREELRCQLHERRERLRALVRPPIRASAARQADESDSKTKTTKAKRPRIG